MNWPKPDPTNSALKSTSPLPQSRNTFARTQKLPNISTTQKLVKKYFLSPGESPREKTATNSIITQKPTVLELPSPSEEKKSSLPPPSPRIHVELKAAKSETLLIQDQSLSVNKGVSLLQLQNEIKDLKRELKLCVSFI